jgi:hypothetical protein
LDNFDQNLVHISRIQTRGRKCITTIRGIADEFDLKTIVKFCKRVIFHLAFRISNATDTSESRIRRAKKIKTKGKIKTKIKDPKNRKSYSQAISRQASNSF